MRLDDLPLTGIAEQDARHPDRHGIIACNEAADTVRPAGIAVLVGVDVLAPTSSSAGTLGMTDRNASINSSAPRVLAGIGADHRHLRTGKRLDRVQITPPKGREPPFQRVPHCA